MFLAEEILRELIRGFLSKNYGKISIQQVPNYH